MPRKALLGRQPSELPCSPTNPDVALAWTSGSLLHSFTQRITPTAGRSLDLRNSLHPFNQHRILFIGPNLHVKSCGPHTTGPPAGIEPCDPAGQVFLGLMPLVYWALLVPPKDSNGTVVGAEIQIPVTETNSTLIMQRQGNFIASSASLSYSPSLIQHTGDLTRTSTRLRESLYTLAT